MILVRAKRMLLLLALSGWAGAQQFEIGAVAGGGFLNSVAVRGATAAARAGFTSGPVAGIVIEHHRYSRWSGEIRYLYEWRSAVLRSGALVAEFAGQAHVLQYDVLLHATPRTRRAQAFVTAGGGGKIFRGTGAETAYRPLMEYAYLTRATEAKPMLAVGGGLKWHLSERILARVELQTQITGLPRKIITPAPHLTLGGWLFDLVPVVGLTWMP